MKNSTEFDLQEEQQVETVEESADISLSAIELDLVGGGGPIAVYL
jgi:hypothetical protein